MTDPAALDAIRKRLADLRDARAAADRADHAYLLAAGWRYDPEGVSDDGYPWRPPDDPVGECSTDYALSRQIADDLGALGEQDL